MIKKYFSLFVMTLALTTLAACSKTEAPVAEDSTVIDSSPTDVPVVKDNSTELASNETAPTLSSVDWTLAPAKSSLYWTGSKAVGASHTGTIDIKSATLKNGKDGFKGSEFIIDMTTLKDEKSDAKLMGHLKSDDFFGVEKFPEAKLVIKEITPKAEGNVAVTADLTIRDKTNEITFDATAEGSADTGALVVKAEFNIDRAKWDVKFDSSSFFQNLGDTAINDEIEFKLNLAFTPKTA